MIMKTKLLQKLLLFMPLGMIFFLIIALSNSTNAFAYSPSYESGVKGLWNLDETTDGTCTGGGDACDISGNLYNATLHGTAPIVAVTNGYGRDFNGADGTYLDIGDAADFNVSTFTMEAIVKKEGTCGGSYCTILSKGSSNYKGFAFGITSGKLLDVRINDQGSDGLQYLRGTTVLNDNQWYYVAAVVDSIAKTMKLYINGVQEATGSFTEDISASTASVKIGNANDTNNMGFNGVMDLVRFSNVARSSSYIQSVYTAYQANVNPVVNNGNDDTTTDNSTLPQTGIFETIFFKLSVGLLVLTLGVLVYNEDTIRVKIFSVKKDKLEKKFKS